MCKGNADIRKTLLNSREITDTNDYKKFLSSYLKNQNSAAFTRCSRMPWPLTHIHVHVANWVFSVAGSASDGAILHVSASSRDKNVETKKCNGEKNKKQNPKINYVYLSILWRPKFIKYRGSENR